MRSYVCCRLTYFHPFSLHINTLVEKYPRPVGSCRCGDRECGIILNQNLAVVFTHFTRYYK